MALNIIFMGTPEFSVPILESIHQSEHNIIAVYTQKPKKKDRGQKIKITPVHKYAKNNNLIIKIMHLLLRYFDIKISIISGK